MMIPSMISHFPEASLRPPAHDHQLPDAVGAPDSWAMLDLRAYIADRRNATTAYGRMSNGGEIQVTFCVAPPPVLSYLSVWCPDATRLAGLGTVPRILAAEADLVVLRVTLGSMFDVIDPYCNDLFVYHAGGDATAPSLRLISIDDIDDPYRLYLLSMGVLRHRNDDSDPDDDQFYIVSFGGTSIPWQFKLQLYDSKTETWSSKCVRVQGRDSQHSKFPHRTRKVLMLGEKGLMGFVDPWEGILVWDVLDCESLHYITFPRPLDDNRKLSLDPVIARDIAIVQGRIKVIDCFYCSASGAWKASVWSRAATTSLEKDWDRDCMFEIRDSLVDTETLHFGLLPELQGDDDDDDNSPKKMLEGLHITHPTIGLNDDHTVYFMAKVIPRGKRACVLAVDLKNKRLKDVSVFHAERSPDVTLSYIQSRISKYMKTVPVIKGHLKRPGKFLAGSPFKKQAGSPRVDAMMQNSAVSSTGHECHMDLG